MAPKFGLCPRILCGSLGYQRCLRFAHSFVPYYLKTKPKNRHQQQQNQSFQIRKISTRPKPKKIRISKTMRMMTEDQLTFCSIGFFFLSFSACYDLDMQVLPLLTCLNCLFQASSVLRGCRIPRRSDLGGESGSLQRKLESFYHRLPLPVPSPFPVQLACEGLRDPYAAVSSPSWRMVFRQTTSQNELLLNCFISGIWSQKYEKKLTH